MNVVRNLRVILDENIDNVRAYSAIVSKLLLSTLSDSLDQEVIDG